MIIYKATNLINGKVYIGQSVRSFRHRKNEHAYSAKNSSDSYFHRAIRKYRINSFKWEVLCCCFTLEGLNEMEVYFITLYDSFENGYNQELGGLNSLHSEETREKIRQANLGKEVSKETKQKLREAGKFRIFTKKHRENLSKAQLKRWAKFRENNKDRD